MTGTKVKIDDPRLTPDLTLTRNGSLQQFYKGNRDNLVAELRHSERQFFAELIAGDWYWVNGCAECNGEEPTWRNTYVKCLAHDVCVTCKIPRSELKEVPWGVPGGFRCKPCDAIEHEAKKREALAAMPAYDEWDYRGISDLKCPWCDYKFEDQYEYYSADSEEVECPQCDNKFFATAEQTVNFTTTREK